jgi:hypothetical protein
MLGRMTAMQIRKSELTSEDAASGQNGRAATAVANIPHTYNKAKVHGYWLKPVRYCNGTVRQGELFEEATTFRDNSLITSQVPTVVKANTAGLWDV